MSVWWQKWRAQVRTLKRELYALLLAYRDPRVPWYARVWVLCVLAYAFSPIDLIPDFIPILGYLDDLILLPLGILLAIRLIPPVVMTESRERAEEIMQQGKPVSRVGALVIIGIWCLCALIVGWLLWCWWR